jgi:hypothetical protein
MPIEIYGMSKLKFKRERFLIFLRHPLTLMLIGCLLSSALFPYIISQSNRLELIQQKRAELAMEIINQNMEISRRLNGMQTILEIFHKDNSGSAAKSANIQTEQKAMRVKLDDLYLEFDYNAWFWYRKICNKASYLGFSDTKLSNINDIIDDYEKNLDQSTKVFSVFWSKCLREDYDPSDPNIESLMKNTRKQLNDISAAREQLVDKITRMLRVK